MFADYKTNKMLRLLTNARSSSNGVRSIEASVYDVIIINQLISNYVTIYFKRLAPINGYSRNVSNNS